MSVNVTRDEKRIEDIQPKSAAPSSRYIFEFPSDNTETEFFLPPGWKPHIAFLGADNVRGDYEVKYTSFQYKLVFSAAPAPGTLFVDCDRVS